MNEPRALTAALSGPVFQTKNSGSAMHAATRHVERWAPESSANQVRSLRSLGFVDRLVAPWLEVAQRSASMRLFQQYRNEGMAERPASNVSWVFPRPWYQDELDWMAASREAAAQAAMTRQQGASLFTTRGTYVAPAQRQQIALPAALYEHVAPSLSIARQSMSGGDLPLSAPSMQRVHDAYSPLVPFAAVNAAQLMQRAVAPLIGNRDGVASVSAMSPGLRAVLSTMLERSVSPVSPASTRAFGGEPTRSAAYAPELITPPAPRANVEPAVEPSSSTSSVFAGGVVADVSAQRAQIVELQRAARVVAERQVAERTQQQTVQRTELLRAYEAQTVERQRAIEAASSTTDRARVEERVAARIAERQQAVEQQIAARRGEQRLHESAREAAARDAQVSPTPSAIDVPPIATATRLVPQEITNALANLSPQLASVVATNLAAHPERAVQTIQELGEALRNAELIARTAASGGSFEHTRGPRLVMPAGLGGLVATVDQNVAQTERRAQGLPFVSNEQPRAAWMAQTQAAMPMIAPRPTMIPTAQQTSTSAMRMPAIAWLAAPNTPAAQQAQMQAFGPQNAVATGALGATESASPAALQHVAWADRWLARFSGARDASLDLLTASSASPSMRLQALADAAPGTVFVAPQFADHSVDDSPAAIARREAEAPVYAPPIRRYDDNEATPDDVLVAISAAAARARTPAARVPELATAERSSLADAITHAVPVAPAAGLSAQLASSPFAPAFRHMFPVAAAPTFDVRALFGQTLSAAYLAGVLAPAAHEVTAGAAIGQLPGFETIAAATPFAPISREAIEWSPSYVAPFVDEVGGGGELGTDVAAQQMRAQHAQAQQQATQQAAEQAAQQWIEPLTTMRSALLSWNVESIVTPQATSPAMTQTPSQSYFAPGTTQMHVEAPSISSYAPQAYAPQTMSQMIGQSMVDAMSLPMAGAAMGMFAHPGVLEQASGESQHVPTFAAPGMIADRAQAWSVAQERSSADLSFDFVTPELVLAARVYGLGPAEAAQAMRLAIAGPGQLATMASTVNRTFVQAMAIAAAREGVASPTDLAQAFSTPSTSAQAAGAAPFGTQAITAYPTSPIALPMVSATFGVDRRTPRGAYMWPPATVAALGLSAASPDGEQGMPVAALELLAAQSVAALGTYASLGVAFGMPTFDDDETTMATALSRIAAAPAMPALASDASSDATAPVATKSSEGPSEGPSEGDVLTTATTMVASARRAKFEAMYVALGQSPHARTWSPAAKAARALALAGRGDETITALERAQIAWSVLPLVAPTMIGSVFGGDADEPGAVQSTGVAVQRAAQREAIRRRVELAPEQMYAVESRPGLGSLSARAGEALGSYVTPESRSTPSIPSSGGSSPREHGAVLRAPSAQPDYVRTGSVGGPRSSGRFGGGEVEIPTWFEAAARKMFDSQSASAGMSGDISMAELTLVQSAPSTHIAASERSAPSALPATPNPSSQSAKQSAHQHIDVEKVANEVYKHIQVLMDGARARNGEPYL